ARKLRELQAGNLLEQILDIDEVLGVLHEHPARQLASRDVRNAGKPAEALHHPSRELRIAIDTAHRDPRAAVQPPHLPHRILWDCASVPDSLLRCGGGAFDRAGDAFSLRLLWFGAGSARSRARCWPLRGALGWLLPLRLD